LLHSLKENAASPGLAPVLEIGNPPVALLRTVATRPGKLRPDDVRCLTEWRNRALDAESQLAEAGFQPTSAAKQQVALGTVLRSVPEERVLLVGVGRSDGALPGALLVIGGSVYARVVDVRSSVSAALVDRSFSGNISTLEGKPARLAVR
jgi:hypothetical protein